MKVALSESRPLAEAATPADGPKGRISVGIINPGWGSSGYYSSDVLEAAARDRVFAAGTHMYINHPTAQEAFDRPERDLNTLAAVLTEDARWDATSGALVAEAQVFSTWREPIAEMADVIGVSIRGAAEVEEGEADGRRGRIITRLVEGASVDFVTKAGRGGKILQVLESARADVTEASNRERSAELERLVKDAHGGDNTWVWLRDYDDEARTVTFDVENGDSAGTYQQGYEVADDIATALTGDRTEVRVRTEYVPVTQQAEEATPSVPSRPAGQSTANESTQEDTMATTQIEEGRLAQLEKDAGRAPVLESERDAALKERDEAREALVEARKTANAATAERVVREAFDAVGVTAPKTAARLAERAPLTESGVVDEDALKTAAEESAAELAEASGAGTVRGMGGTTSPAGEGDISESDLDAELAKIAGRTVKEA